MEENLEREKKVRADVEKARRKVESDLKMTQEAVEELESVKRELEDRGRKFVDVFNSSNIRRSVVIQKRLVVACQEGYVCLLVVNNIINGRIFISFR